MIGIVKVYTVRFLEDDIWEGSIPHECYENAQEETFEVDDVEEAVDVIERHGLRFEGNRWAFDPDGSYVSDYSTGERTETTAHLDGFTIEQENAIRSAIG